MRCPKCNHVQKNLIECEACGVIFEKYRRFQEKKKEHEVQQEVTVAAKSKNVLLAAVVLGALVLGSAATYFFLRPGQVAQRPDRVARVVPTQEETTALSPAEPPAPANFPEERTVVASVGENTVEKARNATVSIEAPWGTGSGFFVTKNYIVTNRHVVEFDEKQLAEFRDKVETARHLIDLEMEKIEQMKRESRQLPQGPSRSQLEIIIETRIDAVNKILPQQQRGEERLARLEEDLEPSDIKIILADGREFAANYLLVSDKYDLALMSLYSGEYDSIPRAPQSVPLHQGDKVYTIGSPVGLRHTVTAGIFSGYRKRPESDELYLQTDAPINPGNSGGPLIDERGYARGVNTMILQGTEGIGFAIPIDVVFDEFRSVLF